VETFDYHGLKNGGVVRHDPLGGVVAKLRLPSSRFGVFGSKCTSCTVLSLICSARGFAHQLVSGRLYLKLDESLFQGELVSDKK
jgi:hypothetical protein